jgi:hypothetical protein
MSKRVVLDLSVEEAREIKRALAELPMGWLSEPLYRLLEKLDELTEREDLTSGEE